MAVIPKWIRRRIGLQLITGSITILAIVLALSNTYSIQLEQDELEKQLDESAGSLSRAFSTACVEPLLVSDYPILEGNARRLVREGDTVRFAIVRRADGKVAAEYPSGASKLDATDQVRVHAAAIIIDDEEEALGEIVLGISTARTAAFLRARIQSSVRDAILTFLTLGVLLAILIKRVIGRPLRTLTNFAEELGAGNLGASVGVKGHDELGDLARTLDTMRRELKNSGESLVEARNAAESANAAKSEFLANMSHEIRTPMTAILGYAENMLDSELSASDRVDAVHIIRRNGEQLLEIINDILDISKVEAGKMEIEPRPTCPNQVVADVAVALRVRAKAQGISLDVKFDGPIPETIQTDETRLRQILVNLVGNAIKFTRAGSVQLVVGAGDPGYLQFDVVDTGCGMTPEQAERLFQPFAQADSSTTRLFGGTGLGLAISKRFAALLGGDLVMVKTGAGEGSHFRTTVSIGPEQSLKWIENPEVSLCASATHQASSEVHDLEGWRILLAEDVQANQRLISHILGKRGAIVTVRENGKLAVEEALAAQRSGHPYRVILMDMQMPVMGGYEATQLLRSNDYAGPIIALTAHAMDSDRTKCIDAGCDDYSTKPIQREVLIDLIFEYGQASTKA